MTTPPDDFPPEVHAKLPSPSQQLLRFFTYKHLPPDLQDVSRHCTELAMLMEILLPDGAEKTAGLRKLLEAKDCFVRAALPPAEPPSAGRLAEHLASRADAAVVMHRPDESADELIERLTAEGWTLEETETVEGKRVRYMRMPDPDPEGSEHH